MAYTAATRMQIKKITVFSTDTVWLIYLYIMNISLCNTAVLFIDIFAAIFFSESCYACSYYLRSCFLYLVLSKLHNYL